MSEAHIDAYTLQHKTPSDFLQTGNGISQENRTISMVNQTVCFDNYSTIKIGGLVIKPKENGTGILIGIE